MEETVTNSTVVALSGFVAIIALLFLFITKFKWHVFLAFLVPIVLFPILPGVNREVFIEAFETGFGDTVGSIAVVIVLGCLIAEALRHTGGVERITSSMISWVGRQRMALALTLSGFVIGLAIFSDIGYVILNPIVHSAAIAGGVNMSVMSTGLVVSMQMTHAMVPPTPGPLAAIAVVDANIGQVIIYGSIACLVASLAAWLYARIVGPRVESPPDPEFAGASAAGEGDSPAGGGGSPMGDPVFDSGTGSKRITTGWAYAPILIPVVLIAGQSAADLALSEGNVVNAVMTYLGWPVVALGIGVAIAYRNTQAGDREARTSTWVEDALRTSAMIIVVTGLGGSLSAILEATPAVDTIADAVAASGLPVIFLPFVLGVIGNMITGSTTVGVITGASLTAPLMSQTGLSPEAVVLAAAAGSVIIKYMNSSYFWICTSLSRMPLRSALISYGGGTFVGGVVSMAVVFFFWAVGLI